MAECVVLTGSGGGVDCDNASAKRGDILSGKTAGIASSDEVVAGSMHNLSAETPVKDVSRNSVVVCGSVTLDKQSDNVERLSIINTGTDGFIRHNTRIGVSMDTVRTALGITQDKVIAGKVVGGITGTASNDTDARPEHITAPHTAIVRGKKVRGTNPDNGAVYPSALSAGASYTIPRGHHNGNGRVVARDLASQTQANAGAGDILLGKSAWVNGRKINGTMRDYSSGRVVFNGATFDGTLLSGVADGKKLFTYGGSNIKEWWEYCYGLDKADKFPDDWSRKDGWCISQHGLSIQGFSDEYSIHVNRYYGASVILTPSVNMAPFKKIRMKGWCYNALGKKEDPHIVLYGVPVSEVTPSHDNFRNRYSPKLRTYFDEVPGIHNPTGYQFKNNTQAWVFDLTRDITTWDEQVFLILGMVGFTFRSSGKNTNYQLAINYLEFIN